MLIQVTDGVYLLNVSVWLCCYYREGVINTLRGGSVPFEWGVRINSCDFRGGLYKLLLIYWGSTQACVFEFRGST